VARVARFSEFERFLLPEAGRFPRQTVLEIGVGKGNQAEWFLEHILPLADSRYIGIGPLDGSRRVDRLRRKLNKYGNKVTLRELVPLSVVAHMVCVNSAIDREMVLRWSKLVWPMVPVGGVVIWSGYRDTKQQVIQAAVDEFLAEHDHAIIWAKAYKCVRKT